MIKSMTAYASRQEAGNGITVSVEIRCYNSRHLDAAIRLPAAHTMHEDLVRQLIGAHIERGRVEVRAGIEDDSEAPVSFTLNEALADGYFETLGRIRDRYGLSGPITLDHLLRAGGIIESVESDIDAFLVKNLLESAVSRCLEDIDRMREAEGNAMAKDLSERIDRIVAYIADIESRADELTGIYRDRLQDRIARLTGGMVDIDPGRIAQEAAFLADKSDISEEITRAKSHIEQFRTRMDGPEAAGKPLNFLLQEFSREFNTMGSKAGNAEISHIIVSAKTELEKIREQVQNVE